MTVNAHLAAARARIVQGWCQKAVARNAAGVSVEVNAVDAVSWCIYGALAKADHDVGDHYHHHSVDLMREAHAALDPQDGHARLLGLWNDARGRTKEEVLTVFDNAIALAPQQPD